MISSDSGRFDRTEILIGTENMNKLKNASVLVFGLGGVGGYALEALVRSGIGSVTIVDGDRFDITNLNRQIGATEKTVGTYKTDAYAERIHDISPSCRVISITEFYGSDNEDSVDFSGFDYVIDAIDTVSSKLLIIKNAKTRGVPVISAMGTARKLDPSRVRFGDVYETSGCPLARVMRRELRRLGIDSLDVVWSDEAPVMPGGDYDRKSPIGSIAFVPAVAGMLMASAVIDGIIKNGENNGK